MTRPGLHVAELVPTLWRGAWMRREQRWDRNRWAPALGGSVGNSCSLHKQVMSYPFNKYLSCTFSGPGAEDAAVNRVPSPCPHSAAFKGRRQTTSEQIGLRSRGC